MASTTFMGTLDGDPQFRTTKGGVPICAFIVEETSVFTSRDGNPQEVSQFVKCEAWGKAHVGMLRDVQRGDMLLIEGTLKGRWWQTTGGKDVLQQTVRIDNLKVLTGLGVGATVPVDDDANKPPPEQTDQPADEKQDDDSLPF